MTVAWALALTQMIVEARKNLFVQTAQGYAFFVRPINEVLCSADVPAGSDLCVAGLASLLSKTFK